MHSVAMNTVFCFFFALLSKEHGEAVWKEFQTSFVASKQDEYNERKEEETLNFWKWPLN